MKPFIEEPEREEVRGALDNSGLVVCCRIGRVEAVSALTRAMAGNRLSKRDYKSAIGRFERFWDDLFVIELNRLLMTDAERLSKRHALRAYDSVHLAAAISFMERSEAEVRLLCYDSELLEAAKLEGLERYR